MASLLPVLRQRFFDANGEPLAGGKLYSYVAGTSTPAATYTDQTEVTPNSNPVILDSSGKADVWIGSGYYKFILTDSDDVVQDSTDLVSVDASLDPATVPGSWVTHAVTDGQVAADLVGETVDFAKYSSAIYSVEILRGTTVIANGELAVQNLNGTGRVKTGMFLAGEQHGVTFSVSQTGMVAQLKAALSSGPGSGSVKLYRRLISA